MNSIMVSDEASEESEFLSALNASLESFVHRTLKDEQMECIRRIVCHGTDVLAVLPTVFDKSAIYHIKNHRCCGKPVVIAPNDATSGNCDWFILIQ